MDTFHAVTIISITIIIVVNFFNNIALVDIIKVKSYNCQCQQLLMYQKLEMVGTSIPLTYFIQKLKPRLGLN